MPTAEIRVPSGTSVTGSLYVPVQLTATKRLGS